jgi:hypothetical protein
VNEISRRERREDRVKSEAVASSVLLVLFLFSMFLMSVSTNVEDGSADSSLTASASLPHTAKMKQSTVAIYRMGLKPRVASMHATVRGGSLADMDTLPPVIYDEQLGLTFTQSFSSIAYNVTAVEQVDSYGYGPAYLLNGVTNKGYWYQVGLSFDWPYTSGGYAAGFNFNYEVFDNHGNSVFPVSGGGGLDSFNGSVYDGDNVLLSLNFSSGAVVMYAYDWNTGSSAEKSYMAVAATFFRGQTTSWADVNGFFTGLMTEWWHPNPYYGGEARVEYVNKTSALSSGWLWADEWVPSNGSALFSDGQYVSFSDPAQLQNFTTHGAVEAANGYIFITGAAQLPLSVSISPSSVMTDVGQPQLFTSNVTGGASPYTYQWCLNDSAIPGSTGSTLTFTPSLPGSYMIYVNVTDDAGLTAESNIASIAVNPLPSVNVSPTSTSMDVGQSQLFASMVSGGISPYIYQWYLDGVAVSGANETTWTFTPMSAGIYIIHVQVTDGVGVQGTSDTVNVTVNVHDVAVTDITFSKTVVGQGYGLNLTVTIADLGTSTETIDLTIYANSTYIISENDILSSGNSTTISFVWNTTEFAFGNYTLNAYAWPVPGETNVSNNNYTGGTIIVSLPGDITGTNGWPDRTVNMRDISYAARRFLCQPGDALWNPNADIDDNGKIEMSDIGLIAAHFGEHYP